MFGGGTADRGSMSVELPSARPGLAGGVLTLGGDILAQVEEILSLVRRHPDLRRPPICRFSYGKQISRRVMVTKASVAYKRLHPNGTLAEVHVALSMVEAPEIAIELAIPGTPPHESTEVVFGTSETFELLAARFYGDPLRGVNLRLRHPDLLGGVETAGARALVVGPEHPDILAPVRCVSPPLLAGVDFDEEFRGLLALRAGAGTMPER